MPNGDDKNFVRLCLALSGFHSRYGRWPTRVRVFPATLANLRALFSNEAWATLNSRIALIADDAPFIAADDEGNEYNYAKDGVPTVRNAAELHAWLAVTPIDHHES